MYRALLSKGVNCVSVQVLKVVQILGYEYLNIEQEITDSHSEKYTLYTFWR